MKIIIVGCGKVGTSIATELNSEGHQIRVVDTNKFAVRRLADSIDAMGIEGNGAIYETLAEAEVSSADLVIAATARDEVNLYTCLLAKNSGAKNTIARVRNPEYTNDLFRVKEALGLSMSINPELTAAIEISRLVCNIKYLYNFKTINAFVYSLDNLVLDYFYKLFWQTVRLIVEITQNTIKQVLVFFGSSTVWILFFLFGYCDNLEIVWFTYLSRFTLIPNLTEDKFVQLIKCFRRI